MAMVFTPSSAITNALRNGEPYTTGPSGHVVRLLYMLLDAREDHGSKIDILAGLAGYASYLTFVGGHSLWEALYTANCLDKYFQLGLNLSEADSPPEAFVSDYKHFLREIYQDDDPEVLSSVEEEVWKNVLGYYEKNSYYETEAGKKQRAEQNGAP